MHGCKGRNLSLARCQRGSSTRYARRTRSRARLLDELEDEWAQHLYALDPTPEVSFNA